MQDAESTPIGGSANRRIRGRIEIGLCHHSVSVELLELEQRRDELTLTEVEPNVIEFIADANYRKLEALRSDQLGFSWWLWERGKPIDSSVLMLALSLEIIVNQPGVQPAAELFEHMDSRGASRQDGIVKWRR